MQDFRYSGGFGRWAWIWELIECSTTVQSCAVVKSWYKYLVMNSLAALAACPEWGAIEGIEGSDLRRNFDCGVFSIWISESRHFLAVSGVKYMCAMQLRLIYD
jgi:hypothetical protein